MQARATYRRARMVTSHPTALTHACQHLPASAHFAFSTFLLACLVISTLKSVRARRLKFITLRVMPGASTRALRTRGSCAWSVRHAAV